MGSVRRRGRPPGAQSGSTKRALLEAALRLFARHGYAGTSIRAIAREVGLSESVLYAHFASKQAIFDAAQAELGPGGAMLTVDAIDSELADSDPPRFVRSLVAALIDAWDTEESRLFVSFMAREGLVHNPPLRSGVRGFVGQVGRVLARWIEAGWIPEELGAPDDLAWALIAPVVQGRVMWLHEGATPEERREAREQAMRHAELFVRAVFRPGTGGMGMK